MAKNIDRFTKQLELINSEQFETFLYEELSKLPMCNQGHIISIKDIVDMILNKIVNI